MLWKQSRFLSLAILAVLGWACATSTQGEPSVVMGAGAWQALDGEPLLLVEPGRLVILADGDLSIVPIRDRRSDGWVLAGPSGYRLEPVSLQDGQLFLAPAEDSEVEGFAALPNVPEELKLAPLELPAPMVVSPDRVDRIQQEIERRLEMDQEVIEQGEPEEKERVVADNLHYLRSIVEELGWIDRERFGARTSYQATILVKHSGDLPFMLAVLPFVERDFRQDPNNSQALAILVDDTRLMLGQPQLYGSQIETDLDGRPVLAPVERPQLVDERRASLGLPPLEEYLSLVSQALFDGEPVRSKEEAEP